MGSFGPGDRGSAYPGPIGVTPLTFTKATSEKRRVERRKLLMIFESSRTLTALVPVHSPYYRKYIFFPNVPFFYLQISVEVWACLS